MSAMSDLDLPVPFANKSPEMRKFIENVTGYIPGHCATCKALINNEDFHDDLSRREYGISGMCQKCQDIVFNASEDDEESYEQDE